MRHQRFNSKRELFDFFQQSIYSAYTDLLQDNRLAFEHTLLKTYLVENDIKENADPEFYIKNNFVLRSEKIPSKIGQIDSDLLSVSFGNVLEVFVDISDSRIWNIYSLSDSRKCDALIRNITHSSSFDSVWLSHSFLKNMQSLGISRGFGLDYDYEKFFPEDSAPALKMQLTGSVSFEKISTALDSVEALRNQITLSKIKIKTVNEENSNSYILQDIKYNGKITARGSDIDQHLYNIYVLKKKYHQLLSNIEENYRFTWETNGENAILNGSPVYIINEGAPMDIDLLSEKLFDGSMPFKLLGIPDSYNKGKIVDVLDLHIGNTFTIELYPDMFVFYLSENVCGNTILRFITNLQHSYANCFKVVNDNGNNLFEA